MEAMTLDLEKFENAKLRVPLLDKLAERYRSDPDLRSRIDGGDVEDVLPDIGVSVPSGVSARIVVNTAETFHVVLPPDPNVMLADESLAAVAGGKSAGSAGTAGTVGSVGTACTTYGTVSSASSAGSAGSVS